MEPIHRREVVLLDSPDAVKTDVHQVMNPLHPDVYNSLKESVWAEGILVPLLLDNDYAVIDGHNRVNVWKDLQAEGVDIGRVPALVYDAATKYDAYRIAVTTNSVRRDPTEAKPELVRKQLMWLDHMYEAAGDPPDDRRSWSDKRIASTIGIHDQAVRKIRAEMEAKGEIAASTKRVEIQIRGTGRREVARDVAKTRAASKKASGAKDALDSAASRTDDDKTVEVPSKIKVGKKEFTSDEAAKEIERLRKKAKDLASETKGAKKAEENLQAQIDERIESAQLAFLEEVANIKARFGETEPPELLDVEPEAWIQMAKEAESVRVNEAGGIIRDVYTGVAGRMREYMPGEAAQAALRMTESGKVLETLEFVQMWINGVIEEMDNEESLAAQRNRR